MATIAKIIPIPKAASNDKKTTANSLLQHGYNRQPGSCLRIMPGKLPDGRYLTGLDDKAPYILAITDKTSREYRQKEVLEKRHRLEEATGLDLSPKAAYYSEMLTRDPDKGGVAQMAKLQDKDNVFNFADPYQEITFCWVALHPMVASSLEAWKTGKAKPSCQFYVCDPEEEAQMIYKENRETDNSIITLNSLTLDKRKMVARLLALPVSENDKEDIVFNMLHAFITSGEVKSGEYKGLNSIKLFNRMATLDDQIMTIKDLIKQALSLGVYRRKNLKVYEGDFEIASSEEELVKVLSDAKGQEDYLALQIKVDEKKKVAI